MRIVRPFLNDGVCVINERNDTSLILDTDEVRSYAVALLELADKIDERYTGRHGQTGYDGDGER